MKCPICGKEMFEVDPIYVAERAYSEPDVYMHQEVCYNCGFVILKNHKFEEYKRIYREYKEALEAISNAKAELERAKKSSKAELDKLEKIDKIREQRDSLPKEKDDDTLLKDLLLKKKQTKIEESVDRNAILTIRDLNKKIEDAEIKIEKLKEKNQFVLDFVISNHLEDY